MQSDSLSLDVVIRDLKKKKVGQLRRQGLIPAVITGKSLESIAVQVEYRAFENVYKKVHRTQLFDLNLDGKPMKVLIHSFDRNSLSKKIQHVDFIKIDMKEKVHIEVPLVLEGKSPVEDAGSKISQHTMSVHVKCLPKDMPEEIKVDLSLLKTKESAIHVRDLTLPEGVVLFHEGDAEKVVVAVLTMRSTDDEAKPAEGEVTEAVSA